MKKRTKALLIFSFTFWPLVVMGLLLYGYSFTKIYAGQIALNQNIWSRNIEGLLTQGVYHRGLKHRSITFPSTIQYIVYSNTSENGALALISSDMQPFLMDYTLAYRINPVVLQNTYKTYENTFIQRMRSQINNIIMIHMSNTPSQNVWKSNGQNIIKDLIFNKFNSEISLYGIQIHGFWMSNFIFPTLQQYFSKSYTNSHSSSIAYRNSLLQLNSINIQSSSIQSNITANIRLQNTTYLQQFTKNYYKDNITNQIKQSLKQSKQKIANASLNFTKDINSINDSFLSFRNFTEIIFN